VERCFPMRQHHSSLVACQGRCLVSEVVVRMTSEDPERAVLGISLQLFLNHFQGFLVPAAEMEREGSEIEVLHHPRLTLRDYLCQDYVQELKLAQFEEEMGRPEEFGSKTFGINWRFILVPIRSKFG